jgi:hypothetical protein
MVYIKVYMDYKRRRYTFFWKKRNNYTPFIYKWTSLLLFSQNKSSKIHESSTHLPQLPHPLSPHPGNRDAFAERDNRQPLMSLLGGPSRNRFLHLLPLRGLKRGGEGPGAWGHDGGATMEAEADHIGCDLIIPTSFLVIDHSFASCHSICSLQFLSLPQNNTLVWKKCEM